MLMHFIDGWTDEEDSYCEHHEADDHYAFLDLREESRIDKAVGSKEQAKQYSRPNCNAPLIETELHTRPKA
jgi:hypothetical protein